VSERAVLVTPFARSSGRPPAAARLGTRALTGIATKERFFRFRDAVRVTDQEKDGLWIHECKALNLLAYAANRRESWRVFAMKFESTWDWLVREKDSRLSPEAQKLKRLYLDLVEAVDPLL
jgi:hypothetical protein